MHHRNVVGDGKVYSEKSARLPKSVGLAGAGNWTGLLNCGLGGTGMNQNSEAFDRLMNLDALGAVRAWLSGDFVAGEEGFLMLAIRRDADLELTDAEIEEICCQGIDKKLEPLQILKALFKADREPKLVEPPTKPR